MAQELQSIWAMHKEALAQHKRKMNEIAMLSLAIGDSNQESPFLKKSLSFIEKIDDCLGKFANAIDNADAINKGLKKAFNRETNSCEKNEKNWPR